MPTYAYACTACDHRFDVQQAFTDDALTECPRCQGRLRKVFGAVGVVFKGSGFYRTDSRGKTTSSEPAASGGSSAASGGSSGSTTSSSGGGSSASGSGGTSSSGSAGASTGGSSGGAAASA